MTQIETGTAPAAPDRTSSMTLWYTSVPASGRAASWTHTMATSRGTAANPLRTEAARLGPPATTAVAVNRSDSAATSEAGTTTTTPSLTWAATATLRSTTRLPANSRYCLAPPNRVPEPAATMTVQTGGRVAIAAIGSGTR